MGSIESLGVAVRAAVTELPTGTSASAARKLEAAHSLLARSLRDARIADAATRLARAREHLDASQRLMLTAIDRLDHYLTAIGVSGAIASDDKTTPSTTTVAITAEDDWWRARIRQLSEGGPARPDIIKIELSKLVDKLIDRARAGDRDGYRDLLLSAPAATGSRLSSLTTPILRAAMNTRDGDTPHEHDIAALISRASSRARSLLPGLPSDTIAARIRGACGMGAQRFNGAHTSRAVDDAVTGPIVIAALHSSSTSPTGRNA